MFGGKGQVSIEILLIAAVVIAMSLAVFSYYIQIRDTTNALQVMKLEALDQIAESEQEFTIEKLDYKISEDGQADFCIFTDPADAGPLNKVKIEAAIALRTSFEQEDVHVHHPATNECN